MSKKRGMSKRQRLYYEYQNKDKIRQELIEFIKQEKEFSIYQQQYRYTQINN